MSWHQWFRFLGYTLVLVGACKQSSETSPATSSMATLPSASTSATTDPQDELAKLDARSDVPLLPMMANHQKQNMRDHLLAVQEIVTALSTQDFAAVERSASRLGFSEQMGQMCTHMGMGAPGFTERALAFHHTADGIAAAARQRDSAAVMKALGSTLQACTGCHASFKQSVVSEATWNQATATVR